ncbi:reverse transcriptase family protein [Aliivibrio wodanis]|uniref:reverse transcriptase family protein n=1 Tax=Aliivibrio wodanis TaxID=80852 RepID=UPI00406C8DF3
MNHSKSYRWYSYFINKGISEAQSLVLSNYAQRLESSSVPVIFELTHLAYLLGVDKDLLKGIVFRNERFYRNFEIPKKCGGVRKIDSPYPKLQYIQKWVKTHILEALPISRSAYAYVKGHSHIVHAKKHIGAKEIYKADIKNFFENIPFLKVQKVFITAGYSHKISHQLAKICTIYGHLPQGAPSSPILSNIILYDMDLEFKRLAVAHSCFYTRYADDLCFSGDIITEELIDSIKKVLSFNDFTLNDNKSKIVSGSVRKIITGLVINDDGLRVPKKIRREYRKKSYYLIKNGLKEFDGSRCKLDPLYIDSVIGTGAYILQVEPNNEYVKRTMSMIIKLKQSLLS